jgi:hypothetical protein
MDDLAIELIFIVMIVIPVIADAMRPEKALRPQRVCVLKRSRRNN